MLITPLMQGIVSQANSLAMFSGETALYHVRRKRCVFSRVFPSLHQQFLSTGTHPLRQCQNLVIFNIKSSELKVGDECIIARYHTHVASIIIILIMIIIIGLGMQPWRIWPVHHAPKNRGNRKKASV